MENLYRYPYDAIETLVRDAGEPAFRAKQLWQWLYFHGVTSFDAMANLPKGFRSLLAERYSLQRPHAKEMLTSKDGTRKWLIAFDDNQAAEMVYIPEKTRGTLCVSSQIGCTLTCAFCHTGTQRLVRNLDAHEIVGQMLLAKSDLSDWPLSEQRQVSNIVLMGMGEPLFNYEEVAKAIQVFLDPSGLAFSRRRITLSTAGVVPMIDKVGTELGVNLAISLHAVRDDLRNVLVPLNKKYPLSELIPACQAFSDLEKSRRITFEYVMLDDVNDSDDDARALVRLIDGINAKINLIPFNPWPGSTFTCSTPKRIQRFAKILMDAGYPSPVRTPRGQDILAACGQLKSASVRKKKPTAD